MASAHYEQEKGDHGRRLGGSGSGGTVVVQCKKQQHPVLKVAGPEWWQSSVVLSKKATSLPNSSSL